MLETTYPSKVTRFDWRQSALGLRPKVCHNPPWKPKNQKLSISMETWNPFGSFVQLGFSQRLWRICWWLCPQAARSPHFHSACAPVRPLEAHPLHQRCKVAPLLGRNLNCIWKCSIQQWLPQLAPLRWWSWLRQSVWPSVGLAKHRRDIMERWAFLYLEPEWQDANLRPS